MIDPQKVKDCLDECVKDGELRKILYRQGIKLDETVQLTININDTDVVKDYNIPIIPLVDVAQTQISFDEEMKIFLNHAETSSETSSGLLTALYPSSDDSNIDSEQVDWVNCNYIFDIPSQNRKLEFKSGICMKPPPPHICP